MVSFIIQMLDKSNLLVVTGLQLAVTWDPDEGSEDFLKIEDPRKVGIFVRILSIPPVRT